MIVCLFFITIFNYVGGVLNIIFSCKRCLCQQSDLLSDSGLTEEHVEAIRSYREGTCVLMRLTGLSRLAACC